MKFHSKGSFGSKQSRTPEGYLVCHDVPIARTGEMVYGPDEVPVDAGRDGMIRITRDEAALFNPVTVASFEGKPVVNDHPVEDVTPANWQKYAVGTCQHVRRGQGDTADCLIADLLITRADAIQDVLEGKREVSNGYDADYEQLEPGKGRQHNIIGNHVALVERGRCGPRCAIGDNEMAAKRSFKDRIRAAFMARDAEGIEGILKEAGGMLGRVEDAEGEELGGGDNHVHIHLNAQGQPEAAGAKDGEEGAEGAAQGGDVEARLTAIENALAELAEAVADMSGEGAEQEQGEGSGEVLGEDEAPEDLDDDKSQMLGDEELEGLREGKQPVKDRKRTSDATLSSEARDTFAKAELLVPGIRFPVVDSKNLKKTRDSLCAFRKKTLLAAYKRDGKGRDAVAGMLGGKRVDLSRMTCDAIGTLFNGASELAKRGHASGQYGGAANVGSTCPKSIADINAANRKYWSDK